MLKHLPLLLALTTAPALAQVEIHHGYARATPPGAPNGAAFMVLYNGGAKAVTLDGARAPNVDRIELHQHVAEDGVMKMRPVQGGIELPAGGRVELKPGGYHLMLIGLEAPLQPGMALDLQLHFSDGDRSLTLPVKPIGYRGGQPRDHDESHGHGHGHGHGTHPESE